MKIILLITGLRIGGAERIICELADQFANSGHNVTLAYMAGPPELLPRNSKVEVRCLDIDRSLSSIIKGLISFRRLVTEFRPDVVNSHLVHANIFARLARLFCPIKVLISSAHNTDEEGWFRFFLYRITDRLASMSTNVSQEAVDSFVFRGAVPNSNRMLAIPNGINTDNFCFDSIHRNAVRSSLGLTSEDVVLLGVGRLEPQKDFSLLLSAFSLLSDNSTLLIVGQGSLDESLKLLCNELGIASKVIFLGARHDIPHIMSACDIFVLSSAWEGFGLVVAEAMACQRLVVATDSGGVSEVLGDCGFLVPPRRCDLLINSLRDAMALDNVKASEYGVKARARVLENFSVINMSSKYINVYSLFLRNKDF